MSRARRDEPDRMPDRIISRRPLTARSRPWAAATARALGRAGVSPNAISIAGLLFGIAAGAALAATAGVDGLPRRALWAAAAALVQLRLLANMLDGMVAAETNRFTPSGELFNEVPDRVSDAAILAGLGFAHGGHPLLGLAAAGLAVFTAYIRAAGRAAGAPQAFHGPMAKPHRMFVVTVAAALAALLPAPWLTPDWTGGLTAPQLALWIIAMGCLVTSARRLRVIHRALARGAAP